MKRIKSFILTILVSVAVLGILYVIPVAIRNKNEESRFPIVEEEDQLLGEEVEQNKVDISPILSEIKIDTPTLKEEKIENVESKKKEIVSKVPEVKNEVKKDTKAPIEEVKKKEEEVKGIKKQVAVQKESKIGVDRKLISGIPGTMNYKGKLPPHNVKEKGTITISYTVDANGNVISAYRIDGLRSRNTINNAISMIKKHVKAEKSKTSSTGTYTINFK